jgi:branched-chain amino acid transport system ATP-binding protein
LIDGLTGFVPITGRIRFDGRDIESSAPHHRARAGLTRTWQSVELFDDLTVSDNLRVAAERQSARGFLADLVHPARNRHRDIAHALDVLGISELGRRMPHELSAGQRKLVGAARAVAARPRMILMDEPAAGLDTAESREFAGRLRAVRDSGITVLLVDHDMGLVLDVCEYIYVLDFGVKIAEGTAGEITSDARVIESYLGSPAGEGRFD